MSADATVHLLVALSDQSACGIVGERLDDCSRWTFDVTLVSCRRCRKSTEFRRAVARTHTKEQSHE